MNIISTIAELIHAGYSHAQVAVELEAKHAIQVTEAWVGKITGADGFSAALNDAEAKVKAVVEAPVVAAESAGSDVVAEVNKVETEVQAETGKLEADAVPAEEPAPTPAPSAPAQDGAGEA